MGHEDGRCGSAQQAQRRPAQRARRRHTRAAPQQIRALAEGKAWVLGIERNAESLRRHVSCDGAQLTDAPAQLAALQSANTNTSCQHLLPTPQSELAGAGEGAAFVWARRSAGCEVSPQSQRRKASSAHLGQAPPCAAALRLSPTLPRNRRALPPHAPAAGPGSTSVADCTPAVSRRSQPAASSR